METITKKIGILGYGEVGKAIASFYEDPFIQDLETMKFPSQIQFDILHICIPYFGLQFEIDVKFAIEKWAQGALVFIHSTVPVGTTEKIGEYHRMVVHSPVRGVHPNLAQGLKTFPKYVGADFAGSGRLAGEHLQEIGIDPVILFKSKTSELLKLLDTTYYGLAIAFHDYAAKLCEKEGVNFDMVMTEANRSYNKGYSKLGKSNVMRPILFAPEGSKIGGHCVIPNAELLLQQFGDDPILQTILRHK